MRPADTETGTLHVDCDSATYVEMEPGLEYRLIHVNVDDGLVVTQVRAQPFAVSRLHRHVAPVFGYTTAGAWGHDDRHSYRPGTYIFEPPGLVHRFINGPGITEALFISLGNMEYIDPATLKVLGVASAEQLIARYQQASPDSGASIMGFPGN